VTRSPGFGEHAGLAVDPGGQSGAAVAVFVTTDDGKVKLLRHVKSLSFAGPDAAPDAAPAKETRRLRALIERPERATLWGQKYTRTPRLIAEVFGDGQQLVILSPMAHRPDIFVARVDSATRSVRDDWPPGARHPRQLLDDIIEAAEDEYGFYNAGEEYEEDDPRRDGPSFPEAVDWGIGASWGAPFPVSEWVPTPLPRTGRQRTRARWRRGGRR
jgi:hypothetical protein